MYVTCQYCARSISKSNLNRHYSSKKCMKKREEKEEKKEEKKEEEEKKRKEKYKCSGCKKIFAQLQNLNNHYSKCLDFQINLSQNELKDKFKLQIQLKDQEIQFLKENLRKAENRIADLESDQKAQFKEDRSVLNEIAKRPTTQNKNTIILAPYSDPALLIEEKLNRNHILQGIEGVAKCIADNNVDENGNYRFRRGDASRGVLYYKDEENEEKADPKAINLIKSIKEPVKKKSNTEYNEYIKELKEEGHWKPEDMDPGIERVLRKLDVLKDLEKSSSEFSAALCCKLPK